jgi:hypothetical protein
MFLQAEAKAVAEQLASVEKALSNERELSKQVREQGKKGGRSGVPGDGGMCARKTTGGSLLHK